MGTTVPPFTDEKIQAPSPAPPDTGPQGMGSGKALSEGSTGRGSSRRSQGSQLEERGHSAEQKMVRTHKTKGSPLQRGGRNRPRGRWEDAPASESTEAGLGPYGQTRRNSCPPQGLAGSETGLPAEPKESAECPGLASAGLKGRMAGEVLHGSEGAVGEQGPVHVLTGSLFHGPLRPSVPCFLE